MEFGQNASEIVMPFSGDNNMTICHGKAIQYEVPLTGPINRPRKNSRGPFMSKGLLSEGPLCTVKKL